MHHGGTVGVWNSNAELLKLSNRCLPTACWSLTIMRMSEHFSRVEVERFQKNGYLIVPNLAAAAMVDRMRDVTREGVARVIAPVEYEADLHYPGAPLNAEVVGGRTIRRLKQAHARDPIFTEWLTEPKLLARLRQLLGPQLVCPLEHHNCIMTKEPQFSSDTGWHQDIRYWSFSRPDLINVWLALGPERPENGCLRVIPGTHLQQYDRRQFDNALFFREDLAENQPLLQQAEFCPLEPGDVLFFHARTFHSATRNRSSLTKYSVVFTFRSFDNVPVAHTRSAASPELLLP